LSSRARDRYTSALVARKSPADAPAAGRKQTTPEIAAALGLSTQTIRRWAKAGLLPTPERQHRGRRGVNSLYPEHTLAQARWVKKQLEDNRMTIPQVLAALQAGEFKSGAEES